MVVYVVVKRKKNRLLRNVALLIYLLFGEISLLEKPIGNSGNNIHVKDEKTTS